MMIKPQEMQTEAERRQSLSAAVGLGTEANRNEIRD
jgi:hypothetical protein